MIEYTNGKPVHAGDIVHVKNRPYTVAHFAGDYVMLQTMDERKNFVSVYPMDIGAHIVNEHVHPLIRGCLCLP